MSDNAESVGKFKFVSGVFENVPSDELRTMCDKAKQSNEALVMVIASKNTEKQTVSFATACSPEAVKLGANAGNIVREAAKAAGGNGGGRPDTAMAGGKDITKTQEAIEKAKGHLPCSGGRLRILRLASRCRLSHDTAGNSESGRRFYCHGDRLQRRYRLHKFASLWHP